MMIKKINIIKHGKKFLNLLIIKTDNLVHENIVLPDIDIYTDELIKIPSLTIVIMSLVEKKIFFYYFLDKNFGHLV